MTKIKVIKYGMVSMVFALTFAGTKKIESQVVKDYRLRCETMLKRSRSMDDAKAICDCGIQKMIAKMADDGFRLLMKPQPQMSLEESRRVENINDDLQVTENFEMNVFETCLAEMKATKKNARDAALDNGE